MDLARGSERKRQEGIRKVRKDDARRRDARVVTKVDGSGAKAVVTYLVSVPLMFECNN